MCARVFIYRNSYKLIISECIYISISDISLSIQGVAHLRSPQLLQVGRGPMQLGSWQPRSPLIMLHEGCRACVCDSGCGTVTTSPPRVQSVPPHSRLSQRMPSVACSHGLHAEHTRSRLCIYRGVVGSSWATEGDASGFVCFLISAVELSERLCEFRALRRDLCARTRLVTHQLLLPPEGFI